MKNKELFFESVCLSVVQFWRPASSNLFVGEQLCTGFVLLPRATVCIRCVLPTDAEAHLFCHHEQSSLRQTSLPT